MSCEICEKIICQLNNAKHYRHTIHKCFENCRNKVALQNYNLIAR